MAKRRKKYRSTRKKRRRSYKKSQSNSFWWLKYVGFSFIGTALYYMFQEYLPDPVSKPPVN